MTGHTTKHLSNDDLSSCNGKHIRRGSHSDDGTAEDIEESSGSHSEYTAAMYAASLQNLIQRLEFQVKDLQKEGLDDEAALNLQRDLISDLNEDVRRESIRLMALDVDVQRLLALQHAQQMEIQHHIEQRIQDQIRRAQYMAGVKEKISAMLDMAHL
ncbi:hypothetical protein EDB19DRAFT_1840571 [Suillus lakei]|nr:hypothetical protein EDB19DRAFT_1840571 [Suillus lakei]